VPNYAGPLAEVVRNPRYATAMGLLLEGPTQRQRGRAGRQHGLLQAGARAHEGMVQGEFLTAGREARIGRLPGGTLFNG
jgi:cell division ATPase FtsA